jgi:hypothetical protein
VITPTYIGTRTVLGTGCRRVGAELLAFPAIWKLPEGDYEYIDVTITGLHYDTGAAAPEGRT